MKMHGNFRGVRLALATATALTMGLGSTPLATTLANAQATAQRASSEIMLSKGRGQMINLSEPISDVLVSNEKVADVQVRSPRQIYIFAKDAGESTIFATTKSGRVAFSANVRVASNVNSLDQMLKLAMPEASITANSLNGLVLLTGTVAAPEDSAEAERLVKAFVGEDVQVVSRLKTATPLQVMLQVKFAEVNREFGKEIGVNLTSSDATGGFGFLIGQGRAFGTINGQGNGNLQVGGVAGRTTLAFADKFLGLGIGAALDLAESDGLITTLAQPNLTALSGETASFLAGGEIPIPVAQSSSTGAPTISVEYKEYGVSLAFTPTVLGDGRISLRVRPEVSQITSVGSITQNGFNVPALSTRRAETTVELGSGQAFMIGGLLSNTQNNAIEKAPFLGDLPILGSLFRSTRFKRSETELMIIVTPYLVKPVNANDIVLPTDGYRAPNDFDSVIMGQTFSGKSGEKRPVPSVAEPVTVPSGGTDGGSRKSSRRSRNDDVPAGPTPGFEN
jgi:pilus assembly protein CpaC